MSDRHTTPRRIVSIPDDVWEEFGQHVGERERSETIRELLKWWMRRPGVRMPKRPNARVAE